MKVLIVEDLEGPRNFIKEIVSREGHETRTANNGSEGFLIYTAFSPDLVISDIEMPIMNGLELLSEIREEDSETIFVIITGHGSESYAMQALNFGANNYLQKPVTIADLTAILRTYSEIENNRSFSVSIQSMIVSQRCTLKIPTQVIVTERISEYLTKYLDDRFTKREKLSVRLGLSELIMNAFEHGNLEISYDEKSAALQANTLSELREQRLADPRLANRHITIDFELNENGGEWVVSDQGKGFDWESIPDPNAPENLWKMNGRGLFICRRQFDALEYIGCGNRVRARKNVPAKNVV